MSEAQRTIEVKVFRFNRHLDKDPHYDVYRVPFIEGSTVSTILRYINEEHDGGLAHYISCRRGICKECTVRMNGKPVVACTEIVQGDIVLEPVREDWTVKDLIVYRPKQDQRS